MQNWARITTIVCLFIDLARRALVLGLFFASTTEAHRDPAFFSFLMWAAIEATICVYLMREVVNGKFQESAVS
jgi:hypothetical protein